MKNKNIVIAQSGGPSMVINQSLIGAVLALRRRAGIGSILGAKHGIVGILNADYVDLKKPTEKKLRAIAATPSSALGSCRKKPNAEDCRTIFEKFRELNVGYFFYIGGNDSADAARIVADEAKKAKYNLTVYHIPKTIDNDLRSCDHTPGFGSAARFVASAIKGDDLDNRALGGVKIDVVMGRDAGFLTAASALARERADDGPHLIYLPEVPFSLEKFGDDIKKAVAKFGRAVVAVSEGIRDEKGRSIGAMLSDGEKDSHGNVQMSGTGALGDYLAKYLKANCKIGRVRADTFGYLQRSFPGVASLIDSKEAFEAGEAAVKFAFEGKIKKGTVAICRACKAPYRVTYKALPIHRAAKFTKSMPKKYIASGGNDVTKAFIDYVSPIVGELPKCEIF